MKFPSFTSLTLLTAAITGASFATAQQPSATPPVRPRIKQAIDMRSLVTLPGHVLKVLTPERDLGTVEDSKAERLYVVLKRTPEQQAALDALLSEQQNPASPIFHKWLTPEEFGARFGAAQADIDEIEHWLVTQGFEVTGVVKNHSTIGFAATAGGVQHTFHTQLHYWNVEGGKYAATAVEPQIPAALAGIVSGIAGLNQLPPHEHHTPIHQERYDHETHAWFPVEPATTGAGPQPHQHAADGNYNMTPQDFYTIYNVNPTFTAGNRGAGSTVAIIGSGPFNYGTVSGGDAGGTASGGDVATFRKLFGITTPLTLQIQHGDVNFPCSGVGGTDSGESALDVEWSSALAPAATILFNNCTDGNGFLTEVQALVDANTADVISSSLGFSEPNVSIGDTQAYETAFSQAAAQGQTVLSAQGDSGSDDVDFNFPQGTHGLSVDYPGSSPLVLSIGGTDFQDLYDVDAGSSTPQSTYWGATNSQFYGNALSYVPETTWNDSCASPLVAVTTQYGGSPNETTATFCDSQYGQAFGGGGGGGISTFFTQPSWQTGIPGLSTSITKRVTPDVSLFAATGQYWRHALVVCDSGGNPSQTCTSPDTFGFAGGTSFAAPQFAGIVALLKTATGARQGLVQPALYALARAQYASGTACYANGQTANRGVTTGLPVSSCVFHDVTTSGNSNECVAGSPNCFTNPNAGYGVLTSSGNTSTFVDAYSAHAQYDIATGLGSVNVTNLITKFSTAFSSTTKLTANPTSITSAQSTTLTATVTTGTPPGYTGAAPALSGTVSFSAAGVTIGSCTLNGGTCSTPVNGTALQTGANSIVATFTGGGTYPASTSNTVSVTVTANAPLAGFTIAATPGNETLKRGALGGVSLKLASTNGFNGNVTVTCAGGPAGTTCSNLPITVKVNGSASALTGVTFPASVAPGTYAVTFTGVAGTVTSSTKTTFTVN